MAKVSIIIPAWKRPDVLNRCMRSVEYSLEGFTDWQGFIVYEVTDDETKSYLSNLDNVKSWKTLEIGPEPRGHNNAMREGIAYSLKVNPDSEYLMWMDYDTMPSKNCIQRMLAIFESDEKIGVMSPMSYPRWDMLVLTVTEIPKALKDKLTDQYFDSPEMIGYMNSRQPEWFTLPMDETTWRTLGWYHWDTVKKFEVWDYAFEAFMMIRRKCYDQLEPKAYYKGCICPEISRLSRANGWKIVAANRVLYWHGDIGCDPNLPGYGPTVQIRGNKFIAD